MAKQFVNVYVKENKMELKDAIELIYNLVKEDITESSDSEYLLAQEVIEKYLMKGK